MIKTLAPTTDRTLRQLFLALFLRGRTSRGLKKEQAPKSIRSKLALTLGIYGLTGLVALGFVRKSVFLLSIYLHAMTLVLLGMFVAASAGEVLFNKEEADILQHRPVTPEAILWAKVVIMIQVSCWLALSFNFTGLWVGLWSVNSHCWYPLVHLLSTGLEALFCTSSIVVIYQLCLKFAGRERLDNLLTTVQVIAAVAAVSAGQVVPRILVHLPSVSTLDSHTWWVALLPPAWYAGFDDALAGSGSGQSWLMAMVGVLATTLVLWLAFNKLSADYGRGLQTLAETVAPKSRSVAQGQWVRGLINRPPLSWGLPNPISRASFLLTAAYLFRDREVKLRVYPSLASNLAPMIVFLLPSMHMSSFGLVFASLFIGLTPMTIIELLQYSQQWSASDLFRIAPILGPSPIATGVRWAVLLLLVMPMMMALGLLAWFLYPDHSQLVLLLPGILALPIYAMMPALQSGAIPLSLPVEGANSANRGLKVMLVLIISLSSAGLFYAGWLYHFFYWLLLIEAIVLTILYLAMKSGLDSPRWDSAE